MSYNLFDLTELNQFKNKNKWLCNFVLSNFENYKENSTKQREIAISHKIAGIFATIKIVDLTLYIFEREKKGLELEDIETLKTLKEYINISVAFDNFDNDILLKNIIEVLNVLVLPLCEVGDISEVEDIMKWGKEIKSAKQKKNKPDYPSENELNAEKPFVATVPLQPIQAPVAPAPAQAVSMQRQNNYLNNKFANVPEETFEAPDIRESIKN